MTTTRYDHWSDVPKHAWRWPNFSPEEIACRGTGKLLVNEPALDKLQALRDRLGKPLIVNSAYRSPEHNRAVGGATRSKHMEGAAFDIAMANHDPHAFEAAARESGSSASASIRARASCTSISGRRASGAPLPETGQRPPLPEPPPRGSIWPRAAR
jgi:hypothetical protein